MKKFLVLFAIIALLMVCVPTQAVTYTSFVATPSQDPVYKDAMTGYPKEPFAYGTSSTTTTNSSTTAVLLTSLAGRKLLSIYINGTGTLWVNFGGTAVVSTAGMPITSSLENIPVDANVAVSTIASTAFSVTFTQFGVKPGIDLSH